ncbi:hypothetical protein ACN08Y_04395 [Rothia sp. P5764]|uniref:hypothetical protein n=1 Tax=Rothia sp. P5764 TaxID=3402654 RepID=UPI003AD262DD
MPAGAQVVTDSSEKNKNYHYALVCQSDSPLKITSNGPKFNKLELRNLNSGKVPGDRQTVAVVEYRSQNLSAPPQYKVELKANLSPPYIVKFTSDNATQLKSVKIDSITGKYFFELASFISLYKYFLVEYKMRLNYFISF